MIWSNTLSEERKDVMQEKVMRLETILRQEEKRQLLVMKYNKKLHEKVRKTRLQWLRKGTDEEERVARLQQNLNKIKAGNRPWFDKKNDVLTEYIKEMEDSAELLEREALEASVASLEV